MLTSDVVYCSGGQMQHHQRFHCLLGSFLILACMGFAQVTGSLSGDVTDSSGAIAPNARVLVSSRAIGLERVTATDSAGFFTVRALPAADYEIRVESPGFKTLIRSEVRLDTGAAINLHLTLD